MEIRSLANIDFDIIFKAFAQAFADYEMQLDRTQLWKMLRRRGFDAKLSFAAFDGNEIVAFTLNGIGDYNGILTAYDTGTGTLKDYRGQGLATKIFEYSIPYLREANISQYLLEVLQHNAKAISVYRNLGFKVTREFNYFMQEEEEVGEQVKNVDSSYIVKQIHLNEYNSFSRFWDFQPSWQNSFEAIERAFEDFVSLGIFTEDRLIGYCIFEPASGDVTQIAVDKDYRRKGIGSLLLKEISGFNQNNAIKVINTDTSCDTITRFLEKKNIPIKGKQFEMIKMIFS